VDPKQRARLLIALIALLCIGAVWGFVWYRGKPISDARLLSRMPSTNAVILNVDINALRQAGILQLLDGSRAGMDPDYQQFVRRINFDYRQDLDSFMIAFAPTGRFMLVRGRFDWKSLRSYATDDGGQCYVSQCRMNASSPGRSISFAALQNNLMALSVTEEQWGVRQLIGTPGPPETDVPDAPIWLSVPGSVMQSGEGLPDGTRMFAHAMDRAQKLILSFAPEGSRFVAKLDLRCNNEHDAASIAGDLTHATGLLKQLIEREHQKPSPADLTGVLAFGSFVSRGSRVEGRWPIERELLTNLLAGGS
jgi:hypothetical protein